MQVPARRLRSVEPRLPVDEELSPPASGTLVDRPALFDRLAGASRVTQITAPAGSGKTVLLRSWIGAADLAERAGWVSVQRGDRDVQRFWISVIEALRDTEAGGKVRGLTPAPELDGWSIVERLLEDLGTLDEPVWLIIDDLHELRSAAALSQLELLLLRSPARLRWVLATRHDQRLGLHRLRLEGGLTELRAADLRFSLPEARTLLHAAGVTLSETALTQLVERTEGWAAGLRLAALSLTAHPDPDRFAGEFSGSERTVAEYLLAEVLDRQPEPVRRLLLRTSVLDRVNGPLADLLTGAVGGECILQELEEANALVVSLDARRSWFRYHHLLADFLQLELRRTESALFPTLHATASAWYAEHGQPVEAVRHAQTGGDWHQAAGLLADHWFGLYLDGHAATLHELLAAFPAGAVMSDPVFDTLMAADQLLHGSREAAEGYVALAARGESLLDEDRRGNLQFRLAILRLALARQRNDLPAVIEQTQTLMELAQVPDAAQPDLGDEVRALALISLGAAQLWTAQLEEAERHLEQGISLAHRIDRPYLEIAGMGNWAMIACLRSFTVGAARSRQAIELAERHGWKNERTVAVAHAVHAYAMLGQGRLEEAERSIDHSERTLLVQLEPAAGLLLRCARGGLELTRGRNHAALRAFRDAEQLADSLVVPHALARGLEAHVAQLLVRVGEIDRAEQAFAQLDDECRKSGELRASLAALRLAQNDPHAATVALAPVLDGTLRITIPHWRVQAFLLDAIARDALGDMQTADSSLERALDLAEPDGILYPFLFHPAPGLLRRHAPHRTSHASLVAEILDRLSGESPPPSPAEPEPPREPLSDSEKRILRYLPTHLSAPEIAGELYLSVHTVKSHMRHLYAKLGTHQRADTVERARALGLLAPSPRHR